MKRSILILSLTMFFNFKQASADAMDHPRPLEQPLQYQHIYMRRDLEPEKKVLLIKINPIQLMNDRRAENDVYGYMGRSRVALRPAVIHSQIQDEGVYLRRGFGRILPWILWLIEASGVFFLVIRFIQLGRPQALTPMEILRVRYAWGGVTRDEYERMKKEFES
jgi:uncharacterized membrane protein